MAVSGRCKAVIGFVVGVAAVVAIALAIYFALAPRTNYPDSGKEPEPTVQPTLPSAPQGQRVDCLVDQFVKSEAECLRRKCAWDDSPDVADADKCSVAVSPDRGYMVKNVHDDGNGSMVVELSYGGEAFSVYSPTEDIIRNIKVEIKPSGTDTLRITFTDADDGKRYRVPLNPSLHPAGDITNIYSYTIGQMNKKFYVQVKRKPGGTVIFDTRWADLIMEKQFLSLSIKSPTKNVYGFGENIHRHFKHQFAKAETWAMLARDQPPGQDPAQHYDNLYGVHTFHVCIEEDGKAHGVFLLNSNPQDVTLTTDGLITYRTIGGILDFFVFMGPTPENVVQQYTHLIGRPYMPPYWSLGFQLCRYGYKNTEDIKAAVNRTHAAGIPHDVQYADIDYMDGRKDFTIDPVNFGNMSSYFESLRQDRNMKVIIILDPAISIEKDYEIFAEGKAADVYIRWPEDGSTTICDGCRDDKYNMFGYVWPDNKTAFPDFFRSRTQDMWKQWIVNQSREIGFDGLWIDMNEPASFDTNKDKPWNWDAQRPGEPAWNLKCDMSNKYENPPYKTKACHIYANDLRNLSDKTICMMGVQGENDEYKHYDVHNLYGWSQTKPTLVALREAVGMNKRGMVITRSTFAGSGRYAGHWLGDNTANWQHLRDSIIGMLEFNLFGIPYVGADICGFFGNSTAPLCKRWMQLGAFYPFSRNHNGIGYIDHDPAAFDDPTVAELSRSSLETRYSLLPYLYTLFYRANTEGSTVVRSLQFEWPTDKKTLNISEQFLWGGSILFSPILYEDQTVVKVYLPAGTWFNYYTHEEQVGGKTIDITVNDTSEIPIHLRGGSVIPTKMSALTTHASRRYPFKLLVALDSDGEAMGELFWDDGETIDTSASSCLVSFAAANQFLNSTVESGNCIAEGGIAGYTSVSINTVELMGIKETVSSVRVNESPASYTITNTTLKIEVATSVLNITDSFSIQWA